MRISSMDEERFDGVLLDLRSPNCFLLGLSALKSANFLSTFCWHVPVQTFLRGNSLHNEILSTQNWSFISRSSRCSRGFGEKRLHISFSSGFVRWWYDSPT
ncbi:unnamed protein product [Toxocara canis]|uniref:Rhodanese domain-containing protein n=1 Tax=Toxocara canis TaxID=6265 RepID=A0A183VBY3_TOXCA|nr:unnamed protein product [Toxocara canis]